MEPTKSESDIANDVLHLGSASHLSPEEIAKAIAHHKRHHGGGAQEPAAKMAPGKKAHGKGK